MQHPLLVGCRGIISDTGLTHSVVHTSSLKGGYTVVIMRRFELEHFMASIERFNINEMILVPPIVIAIVVRNLAPGKRSFYH